MHSGGNTHANSPAPGNHGPAWPPARSQRPGTARGSQGRGHCHLAGHASPPAAVHARIPGHVTAWSPSLPDAGRGEPVYPGGTRLMGALTLPASGLVYIDTMALIYTVERYPAYWPLLEPLWRAAQTRTIEIVSSELTLMEALVGPFKSGNSTLEGPFEQALLGPDMRLLPMTQP